MNFLKSLFISSFIALAMATTGYAAWMLYRGGSVLAWLGVLLTVVPFLLLLGRVMVFQNLPRTSARLPLLNALGAAGSGLALWSWLFGAGTLAPLLAISAWLGCLLYAYWYSDNGRQASQKIRIGAPLPGFTVKDLAGNTVSSGQLTEKPAILLFYRGNWCPLCMAQIKELIGHYQELSAFGVRIAFISPQPHGHTVKLAREFGVDFEFLTDEGNAAARILRIEHPQGLPMGMQMLGYSSETVLPTVIITDQNGKVVWKDETDNYRLRPEPDIYLDVLRRNRVLPHTEPEVSTQPNVTAPV